MQRYGIVLVGISFGMQLRMYAADMIKSPVPPSSLTELKAARSCVEKEIGQVSTDLKELCDALCGEQKSLNSYAKSAPRGGHLNRECNEVKQRIEALERQQIPSLEARLAALVLSRDEINSTIAERMRNTARKKDAEQQALLTAQQELDESEMGEYETPEEFVARMDEALRIQDAAAAKERQKAIARNWSSSGGKFRKK